MTALREAVDFWNDEFSTLGSPLLYFLLFNECGEDRFQPTEGHTCETPRGGEQAEID